MSAKYEISRNQIFTTVILCLILAGLNLFLLIQNRKLKQLTQNKRESSMTVGTKVLPLNGIDDSGNRVEVNFIPKQKTLLLVYAATCRFSAQNASNWKEILQAKRSDRLRVIGVALGKNGEDFLKKYDLQNQFPTISLSFDALAKRPLFDVTPQTILLDSEGKAEKVWSGVLDEKSFSEVLDSLVAVKPVV